MGSASISFDAKANRNIDEWPPAKQLAATAFILRKRPVDSATKSTRKPGTWNLFQRIP